MLQPEERTSIDSGNDGEVDEENIYFPNSTIHGLENRMSTWEKW